MVPDVTLAKIITWLVKVQNITSQEDLTRECKAMTTVPCIIRLGNTVEQRVAIAYTRGGFAK
jgi:hypothetical protein